MSNKMNLLTRGGTGAKRVNVVSGRVIAEFIGENLLFSVRADNNTFYITTNKLHENGGIEEVSINTFSKENNRLEIYYEL